MSVCLSCGFCCDGTLFNRVPLLEAELAVHREILRLAPGAHHGVQPCAALEGLRCRIYEERPLTCRRYRCLLLEAREADEVSEAGALAIIETVRQLRQALAEAVGRPDGGPAVEAARRTREALGPDARERLEQLEKQLRFHFVGQRAAQR